MATGGMDVAGAARASVQAAPGVAGSPAPAGPRLPRLVREVEIEPELYPGFRATLWVNFTRRVAQGIESGDQETAAEALRQIVVSHNGWCDEDGTPFPDAQAPDFYDAIPTHLAACLVAAIRRAVTALPNSQPPTRRT